MQTIYKAERGLFELRRGRPLFITGPNEKEGVLTIAVEGLTRSNLELIRRVGTAQPSLVITSYRAQSMGLTATATNGRAQADISIPLGEATSAEDIRRLSEAMGLQEVAGGEPEKATEAESSAVALAGAAQLLPAVVVARVVDPASDPELAELLDSDAVLSVRAAEVGALVAAGGSLTQVSEAPVPLRDAENAHFMLFREDTGLQEHVAVLIGDRSGWPDPVPVRVHSACLTGDLFGSLRCDCGDQLRGTIEAFAARGGGVLLYLSQEGRGIGLGNKLRAYGLQQEGLDTVDADCVLGFGADEREYEVAVEMLRRLGVGRVELYTNNPNKLGALERGGILVVGRSALYGTVNRHNHPYMRTKVERAGHLMGEILSGTAPTE